MNPLLARLVGAVGLRAWPPGSRSSPTGWPCLLPLAVAGLTLAVRGQPAPRAASWSGSCSGWRSCWLLLPWMQVIGPDAWVGLCRCSQALFYGARRAGDRRGRSGCPGGRSGRPPSGSPWRRCAASVPFGGFPWGRLAFATIDTPVAARGGLRRGRRRHVPRRAGRAAALAWLCRHGAGVTPRRPRRRRGGRRWPPAAASAAPLPAHPAGEAPGGWRSGRGGPGRRAGGGDERLRRAARGAEQPRRGHPRPRRPGGRPARAAPGPRDLAGELHRHRPVRRRRRCGPTSRRPSTRSASRCWSAPWSGDRAGGRASNQGIVWGRDAEPGETLLQAPCRCRSGSTSRSGTSSRRTSSGSTRSPRDMVAGDRARRADMSGRASGT